MEDTVKLTKEKEMVKASSSFSLIIAVIMRLPRDRISATTQQCVSVCLQLLYLQNETVPLQGKTALHMLRKLKRLYQVIF